MVNQSGKYLYMDDFLATDTCQPLKASVVPDEVDMVSSRLVANEWEAGHPASEQSLSYGELSTGLIIIATVGRKHLRICGRLVKPSPINRYVREELQKGGSFVSLVHPPYK